MIKYLYKALAIDIIIIAENFRAREKTLAFWNKIRIWGENFLGLLRSNYYVLCIGVALAHVRMRIASAYTQRTQKTLKTFTDGSETAKNAKVFYLQSFPLYGI